MLIEKWKDIIGYTGYYQVSDLGNIRSLTRTFLRSDGRFQTFQGKSKQQSLNNLGYLIVRLFKNGIAETKLVHILVAVHFIPNPEKKEEINHKKGIKTDNRVTELEWMTPSENKYHAYRINLTEPRPSLSKKELDRLRYKRTDGKWTATPIVLLDSEQKVILKFKSISDASKCIGVCNSTISGCSQRKGLIKRRYKVL